MIAPMRPRFKRYIGLARLGFHRRVFTRMRPPRIMRLVDLRPRMLSAPQVRRPLIWSMGPSAVRTHASGQWGAGDRGDIMPSVGSEPADILAAHREAERGPILAQGATEGPPASPTPQRKAGPRGKSGEVRRKAGETPPRNATEASPGNPSRSASREEPPRAQIQEVASRANETLQREGGAAGGLTPAPPRRDTPVHTPRVEESLQKPHPPVTLDDKSGDRRPAEATQPVQREPASERAAALPPVESKTQSASQSEAQDALPETQPRALESAESSGGASNEPAAEPNQAPPESEEARPMEQARLEPPAAPTDPPHHTARLGLEDKTPASTCEDMPAAEGPGIPLRRLSHAARPASSIFRRLMERHQPAGLPARPRARGAVELETHLDRSQAPPPDPGIFWQERVGREMPLAPAQDGPAGIFQMPPERGVVYRAATRRGEGRAHGGAAHVAPTVSLELRRPPARKAAAVGMRELSIGGVRPRQIQRAAEGTQGSAAQEGGGPGPALTPGAQAPPAPEGPDSGGGTVDLDQMAADVYRILRRRLRLEREREFGGRV
jgi:hypothetical protein